MSDLLKRADGTGTRPCSASLTALNDYWRSKETCLFSNVMTAP
jgi:hypothetical protein